MTSWTVKLSHRKIIFFLQAEYGIRDRNVTGVQTCALPISFASINFVTCHDGFTLRDLVTYGHKHNEANGEGNRDGSDDNRSWNCGVEGETADPAVNRLRRRQERNML